MTWAWQLLSSLTVSLSPWRTLSTDPQKKWFLAHRPSTSSQGQSRRGSSGAEAGRDLWRPPVPPISPAPGNNFGSSGLAQQPGARVPGSKRRESQGWVVRKGHGTVWPRWEWPRGTQPGEEAWSGPVPWLSLGVGGSHRLLRVPGARAQGPSLPNLGLSLPGYLESWSSLAFCRIWQTSVMG